MNPNQFILIAAVVSMATWNRSAVAEGEAVRVATYNVSLFRDQAGQLVRDLEGGENQQAQRIAEVIQRVRPDILLINEFDYDSAGRAAELFRNKYLAVGQNGCEPIEYPHYFTGPVNTGMPSGRDLDKDGRPGGPADAIGFGRHEGQYGMLLLSKFPIHHQRVRTFQKFLWRDMPGALLPNNPATGAPFYDEDDLAVQRLSSKSFWDVPVEVPARGASAPFTLHLLCSHPTPPVFDGPEDRNGRRNHDEIRLVADYISPDKADYLSDDAGRRGGVLADARFVILGDLNADPVDGDGVPGAMDQLIKSPQVNSALTPASNGGKMATQRKSDPNTAGRGDPAHDTSEFGNFQNLRIDYALPSRGLDAIASAVYWPAPNEPGGEAITASDHRPVWIEIRAAEE
jgi:endonuclease/exonuclease/phosphatase family metal-dependent hydrolase